MTRQTFPFPFVLLVSALAATLVTTTAPMAQQPQSPAFSAGGRGPGAAAQPGHSPLASSGQAASQPRSTALQAGQAMFGHGYGPTTGYTALRPSYPSQPATAPPAVSPVNPFASAQGVITPALPTIQSTLPTSPTMLTDKPFVDYRPPRAISPYMNLNRQSDSLGTVNNYYTLVKPMLEQQAYNEKVQVQVRSLQTATMIQSQAINRTTQQPGPANQVTPGATYMNFSNFYPGYQVPAK